ASQRAGTYSYPGRRRSQWPDLQVKWFASRHQIPSTQNIDALGADCGASRIIASGGGVGDSRPTHRPSCQVYFCCGLSQLQNPGSQSVSADGAGGGVSLFGGGGSPTSFARSSFSASGAGGCGAASGDRFFGAKLAGIVNAARFGDSWARRRTLR